jgi:hypothetical protein
MDFSLVTRSLVSVGDGRQSIRLWDVDENGNTFVSDILGRLTFNLQACLALAWRENSCQNILYPVLLDLLKMELRSLSGIWSKRLCKSSCIMTIFIHNALRTQETFWSGTLAIARTETAEPARGSRHYR